MINILKVYYFVFGSGKAQTHAKIHSTFKMADFPGMGMRRTELEGCTESTLSDFFQKEV